MEITSKQARAERLKALWNDSTRWKGIERKYKAEDVVRLRGTFDLNYSYAKMGAERL